mmetsp:Transcript_94445/g.243932  ORF Transcript_94445/g.243932 Transcript_94445/m.243932 type:complete len:812 (-) Transcript_94445:263-2698(-)
MVPTPDWLDRVAASPGSCPAAPSRDLNASLRGCQELRAACRHQRLASELRNLILVRFELECDRLPDLVFLHSLWLRRRPGGGHALGQDSVADLAPVWHGEQLDDLFLGVLGAEHHARGQHALQLRWLHVTDSQQLPALELLERVVLPQAADDLTWALRIPDVDLLAEEPIRLGVVPGLDDLAHTDVQLGEEGLVRVVGLHGGAALLRRSLGVGLRLRLGLGRELRRILGRLLDLLRCPHVLLSHLELLKEDRPGGDRAASLQVHEVVRKLGDGHGLHSELLEDCLRSGRDEGREEVRKHVHCLKEQTERALALRLQRLILHLPRLQVSNPLVGGGAGTHCEIRRVGQPEGLEGGAHRDLELIQLEGRGHEAFLALWDGTAAERHCTVHQVPQVVAQVRVVHQSDGLRGELHIIAVLRLAAQVPAQRVAGQGIQHLMRIDAVAVALRHLAAIGPRNEAVHHNTLGQRKAGRRQHCGPDHGVEPGDVLPDNVHVGRPEAAERHLGVVAVDAADVIDEGIKPYIHHVFLPLHLVFGAGNAPAEVAAADGEVAQLNALEPLQDLSAVLLGLDELLVLLDQVDDYLLVLRQAEEEAGLRHLLQGHTGAWVLIVPLLGLLVCDETLFAHEVPAFVAAKIDVAHFSALRPELASNVLVPLLGGAHEEVVRAEHALVQRLEAVGVAVDRLLRGESFGLCLFGDLLAMLVSAGHVEDILSEHAVEAREDVRRQHLVGVADVRPPVGVHDGGCDVVPLLRLVAAWEAAGAGAFRRQPWRLPDVVHLVRLAVDGEHLLLFSSSPALLRALASRRCDTHARRP